MCSFIMTIIDLRDDVFRYMGCSESLLIMEVDPDVLDLPKIPCEGGGMKTTQQTAISSTKKS